MSVIALLAFVVTAFASPAAAQSEEATPGVGDTGLIGVEWRVVALGPAPPVLEQSATFEPGGGVAISTGCATYTGTYSVDGDTLSVGTMRREFGSIQECGFGERGSADTFRNVMESAQAWAIDDEGRLVIEGSGNYAGWTLTFEPGEPVGDEESDDGPVADLEQVAGPWRLETMDLGPAGSATLPKDIEITLTLAADGTLSGLGGCSDYEGSYAIVGGDTINVADVSAADTADCEDQLADLQQLYLGILPVIDGISIEDGALILSSAMLTAELVFQPRPAD